MIEIKRYKDSNEKDMAILLPSEYSCEGIQFFTSNESYQQVAFMSHPKNYEIEPHYHNKINRIIDYTCETLILRKGILGVDLYENNTVIHSFVMNKGDILTLLSGGHGFKVIEDVEFVEIKQGPYLGEEDKTRFV